MKIVFGWYLDGPTCPETPDGRTFAIDAAVVGPAGLLNLLEMRLGLNAPATPPARRIAQYVARLRAIDDGRGFFSRSFAADAWATARLLLSRRDELAAAGWSPASRSWRSERLAVLARAEALEEPALAPWLADRARSILTRVHGANPIDDLTLVDDPERLPFVWRRLIEALAASGTNVVRATVEHGRASGDLAAVQALISGREPGPLTGDATFSVVRYDNALAAGDIAAEWLAASPEANADVVIIRQGNPTILDAACRRLGLPPPGGNERSPFRGALQALSLAFETAWRPLDAERVLELLVMHGSPIPYRIGRHFANVLRDFPGTGGARWRGAWDAVVERLRRDLSEDGLDTAKRIRQIRKSVTEWKQWLEPERFDRNSGVTVKAADAICRKVERWAFKRGAAIGDEIYMEVASAAAGLAATIADSRIDPISKPQLDRMIDAVIAGGIERPAALAGAAPWTTVDDATEIWGRAPAVLWWGFAEAQSRAAVDPWRRAEREELAAAGAPLQSRDDMTALRLDAERRAFLNVVDRMLLIMPAASETESGATHPVWHELANLDGLGRTIVDGRGLRRGARVALGGRAWETVRTDHRPLPPPIRSWTVPAKLIGARETESATSLESLLGCPMRWVLQYGAGLRKRGLLDMTEGNRLKGSVAHEVLARFLAGPRPDDEAGIRSAVKTILDAVLPEIGSPLLLPGRWLDEEDVRPERDRERGGAVPDSEAMRARRGRHREEAGVLPRQPDGYGGHRRRGVDGRTWGTGRLRAQMVEPRPLPPGRDCPRASRATRRLRVSCEGRWRERLRAGGLLHDQAAPHACRRLGAVPRRIPDRGPQPRQRLEQHRRGPEADVRGTGRRPRGGGGRQDRRIRNRGHRRERRRANRCRSPLPASATTGGSAESRHCHDGAF